MKKELEKLWYSYIIEEVSKRNDQEKELIKNWSVKESEFRTKLNDEQKALLEEYDAAVCKMNSASEKNAFVKGIKFATRFFIEALCQAQENPTKWSGFNFAF